MLKFIGIDPGKEGAVGYMDGEHKNIGVRSTPTFKRPAPTAKRPDGMKREYDFRAMYRMLKELTAGGGDCFVTIEQVHSIPSDSHTRAFDFGGGFYAWLAILNVLAEDQGNVHILQVPPNTWKASLLAGVANDPETEAKVLAQRLRGHPVCLEWRGKRGKLLDGKVDALFLAEHGRINYRFRPVALGGAR